MFDIKEVRKDFPILSREVYGKPLVYLDSAASSQKPRHVMEHIKKFEENDYANVHRGIHFLSNASTDAFEMARKKVKIFLNANREEEIIFTLGATDSINLVANSLGENFFKKDDEIILTVMEHHSNIVPWHFLREKVGVKIKWVDCDDQGNISLDDIKNIVTDRTKLISITEMSNVLGSKTPLKEIIKFSHEREILVLVDGCQGAAHNIIDVQELDCDFYVFSGHKIYGPTGVGVLYGKFAILDNMPPWRGGGEMIREVKKDSITYADLPSRFEAGTPNITQAIGLGFAIDYFTSKINDGLFSYEKEIAEYFHNEVQGIKKIKVYGEKNISSPLISFTVDGTHPHDIATLIDREGVAIRAGHHCCQPLLKFLNVNSTARASIGMYTDKNDIDIFIKALDKAITFFD
ncbi:SufS family cysteine desulfurase [Hyphomicrobiales bacterium]|nr:SufS family cysteine desulfurase [Hyphomicrobiales bacterium]